MKGAEDEGYSCFWKYNIYGSSHIFLFMHVHSALMRFHSQRGSAGEGGIFQGTG
jgi:hypothetical protein